MRFTRCAFTFLAPVSLAFLSKAALAQGVQPFSTQVPGPLTTVDMASTNILISIPIRAKVGAIPFQYSLVGNSVTNMGMGTTSNGSLPGTLTSANGLFGGFLLWQFSTYLRTVTCVVSKPSKNFSPQFVAQQKSSHTLLVKAPLESMTFSVGTAGYFRGSDCLWLSVVKCWPALEAANYGAPRNALLQASR